MALTQRGVVEAIEAGQVFASHGLTFRKCYTSMLTRSIVTAQRSLEAAGVAGISVTTGGSFGVSFFLEAEDVDRKSSEDVCCRCCCCGR